MGVEHRIVRHQVGAIALLEVHANGLPDFHRDGPFGEGLIQNLDGALREPGLFKILRVEGGAPRRAATRAVQNLARRPVGLSRLVVPATVLNHHTNIEDVEIQTVQEGRESGIIDESVRVSIDGCEGGKA